MYLFYIPARILVTLNCYLNIILIYSYRKLLLIFHCVPSLDYAIMDMDSTQTDCIHDLIMDHQGRMLAEKKLFGKLPFNSHEMRKSASNI